MEMTISIKQLNPNKMLICQIGLIRILHLRQS